MTASTLREARLVRAAGLPEPKAAGLAGRLLRVTPLLAVVVLYGALGWHRRWMSDDGLIVLRTVRQLLAGNGPVFNLGERVEANTSTVWPALLTAAGLVPGVSLEWASVVLGLLASVAGLAFGLAAAARLAASWSRGRWMLPAGGLVACALPPFWDFATSGLETGLCLLWVGATWWLLVRRLRPVTRLGRAWPVAVLIGLGPLVRPDLTVFAVAAAAALAVLEAPRGWRRLLGLAGAALALPAAYELFRAGYYGLLVPSPALAKEAGQVRWHQGWAYLSDLVGTYLLWLPLAVLALVLAAVVLPGVRRGPPRERHFLPTRRAESAVHAGYGGGAVHAGDGGGGGRAQVSAVVAAPVVAALLMALYVVRVGGDFMHGRMLLPAVFCLLLPVLALPLTRATLLPVLGVLVWAVFAGLALRVPYAQVGPHLPYSQVGLHLPYSEVGPDGIADERGFYVALLGTPHPVSVADHRAHFLIPAGVQALAAADQPSLALLVPGPDGGPRWATYPVRPELNRSAIFFGNLGVAGALAPLDTRVVDDVGLAYPLASHATSLPAGRIGHDKDLPPSWLVAEERTPQDNDSAELRAARAALACPRLAELVQSVQAPLTAERFWRNVVGAVDRTALRFPRDPIQASSCA